MHAVRMLNKEAVNSSHVAVNDQYNNDRHKFAGSQQDQQL